MDVGAAVVSADRILLASLWEASTPHMVRAVWKVGKVQMHILCKNELSVVFIPFVLLVLELFGVSLLVCNQNKSWIFIHVWLSKCHTV
jgi:hypothetical protein